MSTAPQTDHPADWRNWPVRACDSFADWCRNPSPGFLSGHLAIGTRSRLIQLADPRDAFLGSINRLDVEDQWAPRFPYVQWNFTPYVGIEAAWERFEVETIATTTQNVHTDGAFEISGSVFCLFGRYPNRTPFTPTLGLGYAFIRAEFDMHPVWHNGFSFNRLDEYEAWRAAGSPAWPNDGYQRTISAGNTEGWVVTGGCEVRLCEHVAADLTVRYMDFEVPAHYYLSRYGVVTDDRGHTDFPMACYTYAASLKYVF